MNLRTKEDMTAQLSELGKRTKVTFRVWSRTGHRFRFRSEEFPGYEQRDFTQL